MSRRGIATFLIALALANLPAAAAELGERAAANSDVTYFDLMKLVVVDLAPDGKGGASGDVVVPYAHIEGRSDPAAGPRAVSPRNIEPLLSDGARLALLAELAPADGSVAGDHVIALFRLAPEAKLVALAAVGFDGRVSWRAPRIALGANASAFVIETDRGESLASEIALLRGDRVERVDAFFLDRTERSCGFERTRALNVSPSGAATPYRALRVVIEEHAQPTGETCARAPTPRKNGRLVALYRWDSKAGAYRAQTSRLERFRRRPR